jgi:alpha-N-arabinofuranosidase
MRAEYAADETRRYATFVKAPAGTQIIKIASGASDADVEFTRTMMQQTVRQVDALSLHHYTVPGGWPPSRSATQFGEDQWAETLDAAYEIDQILASHIAVMDQYDPDNRVWLALDEWGAWYAPDPGTNPGFLRQQNSLRDALLAAIHLNVFARHADRVKMTAIAQMINVLQAMIITEGDRMVRTPTFHVFAMYVPFQDGTVLPLDLQTPDYTFGEHTMPAISASAVRGRDGKTYVALANVDPDSAVPVSLTLDGLAARRVSGRVLTGPAVNAHNTIADPAVVVPVAFSGARITDGHLTVTMPARSVVVLQLD